MHPALEVYNYRYDKKKEIMWIIHVTYILIYTLIIQTTVNSR